MRAPEAPRRTAARAPRVPSTMHPPQSLYPLVFIHSPITSSRLTDSHQPPIPHEQVGGVKRGELQVRAARVAGVEIPNNKKAEIALTYVYGVGNATAKKIMAKTGLENKRVREFEEEELTILRAEVDTYMIEGDLRRFNMLNIKRLKEIQCYRGRRHIRGLPVRGQRTKTNARTRKGKVKTVAGKKVRDRRSVRERIDRFCPLVRRFDAGCAIPSDDVILCKEAGFGCCCERFYPIDDKKTHSLDDATFSPFKT